MKRHDPEPLSYEEAFDIHDKPPKWPGVRRFGFFHWLLGCYGRPDKDGQAYCEHPGCGRYLDG